jgi:hypothetical protein
LVPSSDGGDDFVGIGDPREGLRLGVVVFEEPIDRRLEVDDGPEDAAFETALGQDGEEALERINFVLDAGYAVLAKEHWTLDLLACQLAFLDSKS